MKICHSHSQVVLWCLSHTTALHFFKDQFSTCARPPSMSCRDWQAQSQQAQWQSLRLISPTIQTIYVPSLILPKEGIFLPGAWELFYLQDSKGIVSPSTLLPQFLLKQCLNSFFTKVILRFFVDHVNESWVNLETGISTEIVSISVLN